MNQSSPIVAALDIGTTKICAIVARKNQNGKVEILGIGKADSLGVTRGVISNIDKTVRAIQSAIHDATRRANIDPHHVYVGIAGQHVKSLQHRGYLMRSNHEDEINRADIEHLVADMHKLVLPPGDKIIHVLPQEFIVDNEEGIKDPVGMSGVRLEADFHIITGQIAAIKNIHRCVEKGGFSVGELILEPIASVAAVLNQEELEAGVALVDIGGGTTDIAIFQEGIIRHTAVIPLGGDIITEDIKEGCMVMRDQAEKLKQKFGSALASEAQDNAIVAIRGLRGREPKEISLRNLARIIQARMEEILEYVHYEIRRSGYENKLIGGIVLTGGGARLKNLKYLVEYMTGLDARIGVPTEKVANAHSRELQDPMYATGIGLVVKALEEDPIATEKPAILEPVLEEHAFVNSNAFSTSAQQQPDYQHGHLQATNPSTTTLEHRVNRSSPSTDHHNDEMMTDDKSGANGNSNGNWWGNFLRKSREWLEGDVGDFK